MIALTDNADRGPVRVLPERGPSLFYLGTHHPHWLGFVDVPLFVSRRQLRRYKTLPRRINNTTWALDSGGFTELSMHGKWITSASDYARDVLRYRDEIGGLAWAAPQDWMCEPIMLAKTGLTIEEHQRRTVASVIELRALGAPVIPVLQGWGILSYVECWDLYAEAGIDLLKEPIVGLGSVCRRQNMVIASTLVGILADGGLKLHGFGFKATGLKACGTKLASSDSLAWSYHARREPPRWECRGKHKNCANCPAFALEWREELLESIERGERQQALRGVA